MRCGAIYALLGQCEIAATEQRMGNEGFNQALESSREIELTVTGRTSGREISIPVWFVQEGDKLYLVPVRGSDATGTRTC
jgi:hypothetical protein